MRQETFIHKQTGIYPIGLRDAVRNGFALATHFLVYGVWLSINQQMDPDTRTDSVNTLASLLALIVLLIVVPAPFQLGLLLLLVNPLWLYAFPDIHDTVMENRAYLVLLAKAVLGAAAFQLAPIPTAALMGLYFIATLQRNMWWATRYRFWKRAATECPDKLRPQVNYAVQLGQHGQVEQAMRVYESLIQTGRTEKEVALAASNLSLLYLRQEGIAQNPEDKRIWLRNAATVLEYGKDQWPTHELIRYHRGRMFMMFEKWREAIAEFDVAIQAHPRSAVSLMCRAQCWGQLGDRVRAQQDGDRAEKIDGIQRILRDMMTT